MRGFIASPRITLRVAFAPSGLVSWWRAESNALDAVGFNHGVPENDISFTAGDSRAVQGGAHGQ
jgi:hypothetical protein